MTSLLPLTTKGRLLLLLQATPSSAARGLATSTSTLAEHHFRLVVVGGGAGGCGTANKFVGKVGKGQLAVIEPASTHYYQAMWTLVGGGLKTLDQSARPMKSLLPSKASWIKDSVTAFHPSENKVVVSSGDVIHYDFLVVALGFQLRYDKIKGLPEAFETPGVCSNYSPLYVGKTTKAIHDFKGGNAVFTFPTGSIKCPGAPQKIMYLAEESFRLRGIPAIVHYYTSLPVIFGVKKYAKALTELVQQRGINLTLRHNLIEVIPDKKLAVFENLDTGAKVEVPYDLLHVSPPMNTPPALGQNRDLADEAGFLTVNKQTLQHVKYPNIFGIGDCTNSPNSKTAAAVAGQLGIIRKNLGAALAGAPLPARYDGYTSCPLVTGRRSVILAEFDFQSPPQPLETFPVNQAKERWSMFQMKAHVMPPLYFHGLVKGWWEGPAIVRKAFRLGMSR